MCAPNEFVSERENFTCYNKACSAELSHIPPCSAAQSKVRDLEEKCRIQSEQFGLLSQELEKFRLQASKVDLAGSSLLNNPSFSVLTNGVGLTTERGELRYCVLDAVFPPVFAYTTFLYLSGYEWTV